MTKKELHQRTVETVQANTNTLLEWATGTGKTMAALEAMRNVGGNWLVVLSERQHISNWYATMQKHDVLEYTRNMTIILYASLHKYENGKFKGIIFDEAHHLFTEKRLTIFKTIEFEKSILLSATMEQVDKQLYASNFGGLKTIKISLKRAIELGFLPKPEIILHKLFLDDTKKYLKYKYGKKEISVTERQYYDKLTESMEYWKKRYFRERHEWVKMRWLQAGTTRKRFLANLKTDIAKDIIKSMYDRRFICFTGSIKQAEEIGGKNIVNSKKSDNDATVDRFNSGQIDNIFATGMLKEGTNLYNIDAGIIIQLSSKLKDFIQMLGRSLRSKGVPEQHILYYADTQDEKYLNNIINEIEDYVKMEVSRRGTA